MGLIVNFSCTRKLLTYLVYRQCGLTAKEGYEKLMVEDSEPGFKLVNVSIVLIIFIS